MPSEESGAVRTLLTFQVGAHLCALESASVSEVVFLPELVRSPTQPPLLDGFLNLRGTVIPVVPLHRLFGLPVPEPEIHTPILICPVASRLALRVDRVLDVVAIAGGELHAYETQDSLNQCAEAQFSLEGREIALLSPSRLLLVKEKQCLEQLQEEEQRRLEALGAQPT